MNHLIALAKRHLTTAHTEEQRAAAAALLADETKKEQAK